MIVQTMAKHREFFIDVMMRDELGMEPPEPDGGSCEFIKAGAICFASFLVCGSVPLLGYVAFVPAGWGRDALFALSCALTAVMLFILGALKSRFTLHSWYASGLEVLSLAARVRRPRIDWMGRRGAPTRLQPRRVVGVTRRWFGACGAASAAALTH